MSHQATIYDYYVVLPHPSESSLLLIETDGRWSLPHWSTTDLHWWQTVDHVNGVARSMLGVDVTTLRCITTDHDSTSGHVFRVHELEAHESSWMPPANARWMTHDDLGRLTLVPPWLLPLLESWRGERESGVAARRPPWMRPGWYAEAAAWIRSELAGRGLRCESLEQVRSWERSSLIRVRSSGGVFYFKAVPPMFAHEARMLPIMSQHQPGRVPDPVALDLDRSWMLLREFRGHSLADSSDAARWHAALGAWATLQRDLTPISDHLIAFGCPRRPPGWLSEHLESLLMDDAALLLGRPGGLTRDEASALRRRIPEFHALAAELESFNVPLALEHGDLWGNIIATEDGFLFFDWSDSSIAHPFFSLAVCVRDLADLLGADAVSRLRDAYLQPWTGYESLDRLRRAWEIATQLAPLHHALGYHRHILPNMTARWEMERMLPFYLRMAL